MNLSLIGYGFVGQAVHEVLKDHYDVKIIDPKYNDNVILNDSDGYIVCVPTPGGMLQACDMSIVDTVIKACPEDKPILIKSTISLEGYEDLKKYNKRITFSPEFLTAANANEDFKKQNRMLFGGADTDFWYDIFILAKGFQPVYGTIEQLIMAKYLRNSFLATKVAFFNEVYDFCSWNGRKNHKKSHESSRTRWTKRFRWSMFSKRYKRIASYFFKIQQTIYYLEGGSRIK